MTTKKKKTAVKPARKKPAVAVATVDKPWYRLLERYLIATRACARSRNRALRAAQKSSTFKQMWENDSTPRSYGAYYRYWLVDQLGDAGLLPKQPEHDYDPINGYEDCWCQKSSRIREHYPAGQVLMALRKWQRCQDTNWGTS